MKVDKAFEKKMDEKFKAWWEPFIETNVTLREVIKDELSISCIRWLFHIGFSLGSDAGAEYGSKQGLKAAQTIVSEIRAYYSEDIFPKDSKTVDAQSADMARITCDNIDTELEKLRSE